jgi:hypothetical protein
MPFHTTASEHFNKLKRVYGQLDAEVHKDDLDDFFKTAYHLIEITEKCSTTTATQKAQASALRRDLDMELSREIANRQKHYTLSPRSHPSPAIASATVAQGFGVGRFGAGAYGVGEQSVVLNFIDGTQRDARDLANAIFQKFANIFP